MIKIRMNFYKIIPDNNFIYYSKGYLLTFLWINFSLLLYINKNHKNTIENKFMENK